MPGFLVNRARDHFKSYKVSVTKTRATKVSDAIELLPSKYTMPKTLSNDRISAAFEKIVEALNNPKLREGFLNCNKENEMINILVEIFNKQKNAHKLIAHVRARVSRTPNTDKIAHLPTRMNHNSNNDKIPYVPARVNHSPIPAISKTDKCPKKITHVPTRKSIGEGKSAKMQIPTPLAHFPTGTVIYKLFSKEYWKATVIRHNTRQAYYTVQYNNNNEEELTYEEIKAYLIPPERREY